MFLCGSAAPFNKAALCVRSKSGFVGVIGYVPSAGLRDSYFKQNFCLSVCISLESVAELTHVRGRAITIASGPAHCYTKINVEDGSILTLNPRLCAVEAVK